VSHVQRNGECVSSVRKVRALALAGLAAVALTGFRVQAEPVAVLAQVEGAVQVRPAAGGGTEAARVGRGLFPGDSVAIGSGGRAVLLYRTGRMQTTTQGVRIAEPREADSGTLYERTVRTIGQVATTDVRNQPNRQGMIRPVPGLPSPIAPRNEIAILDVRPTLTWYATPGATNYMVQLRRTDAAGARAVRFETGTDTTWHYPAGEPALEAGGTYEWTVAAGGRVASPQRFRVAAPAVFAAVAAAVDELRGEGVDPAGDGMFVMAIVYRDAGLFYDADAVLRRLSENGGGGRFFHMLRGLVFDALGDLDASAAAFAAADRETQN
jgi:hypothetical protein